MSEDWPGNVPVESNAKIDDLKVRYMPQELYEHYDEIGQLPKMWVDNGWHFCAELDYALVHRHHVKDFCRCFEDDRND